MFKGNVNIDFVNNEMLAKIKFIEHNHVLWCAGIWEQMGVPVPDFPYDAPWVYQSFENDCPLWAHDIKRMFADVLLYPTVTINLLKPGRYIPPHKDMFYRLLKDAPTNIGDKEPVRINIFLQDCQLGHIFEMGGETWLDYKKGDYTVIHRGIVHTVVNVGYQPRYTMQISGFADKGHFT